VRVKVEQNALSLQKEIFQMGWRVYATNQGAESLTLLQSVQAYRGQYVIEHRIGRLKGKQLSLSPLYLSDEERIKGLIRLLTIALRVLTLIEFQVRKKLEEEKQELSGICRKSETLHIAPNNRDDAQSL
jgi:transposase